MTRKQQRKYSNQVIRGKLALVDLAGRLSSSLLFFFPMVSVLLYLKVCNYYYETHNAVNEHLKQTVWAKNSEMVPISIDHFLLWQIA